MALVAVSAAAALSLAVAATGFAQTTPLDTTPSANTARPDSAAVKAAAAKAAADSAEAQAPIRWNAAPPSVRDTTFRHVKPFLVMTRSAIVPGWGQVYNRQPLKAALVVAGEGYLTYKIFQELSLENDAIDRRNAAVEDVDILAAEADRINHKNRKIDWIWWTAAAHLLQMADAYVDAHFINFDAEFGPDDDRSSSRGAPRLSLSLNVRF